MYLHLLGLMVGLSRCKFVILLNTRGNLHNHKKNQQNYKLHRRTLICQLLATGQWFSPISSTNKTDCNDITEILLKVVLNTINQPTIIMFKFQLIPKRRKCCYLKQFLFLVTVTILNEELGLSDTL